MDSRRHLPSPALCPPHRPSCRRSCKALLCSAAVTCAPHVYLNARRSSARARMHCCIPAFRRGTIDWIAIASGGVRISRILVQICADKGTDITNNGRICMGKGKNFTNKRTDGFVAPGGALDPNDHRRRRRHDARACDKATHTRQPVCIKPGPVHPWVQCKLPPTPPSRFRLAQPSPPPPAPTDPCTLVRCACARAEGAEPHHYGHDSPYH